MGKFARRHNANAKLDEEPTRYEGRSHQASRLPPISQQSLQLTAQQKRLPHCKILRSMDAQSADAALHKKSSDVALILSDSRLPVIAAR